MRLRIDHSEKAPKGGKRERERGKENVNRNAETAPQKKQNLRGNVI